MLITPGQVTSGWFWDIRSRTCQNRWGTEWCEIPFEKYICGCLIDFFLFAKTQAHSDKRQKDITESRVSSKNVKQRCIMAIKLNLNSIIINPRQITKLCEAMQETNGLPLSQLQKWCWRVPHDTGAEGWATFCWRSPETRYGLSLELLVTWF